MTDARHALRPLTPHAPLCRRKIIRSAQTLEELAEWLKSGDPVDARVVAQVRLLLIGDRGELYDHRAADDLGPALHEGDAGARARALGDEAVRARFAPVDDSTEVCAAAAVARRSGRT